MSGDRCGCSDRRATPQASKALLGTAGRDLSGGRHLRQRQDGADLGSTLLTVMPKYSRDKSRMINAKGEGAIFSIVVAVPTLMSLS